MPQATFSIRELARLTGWDRKKISAVFAELGEGPTLEEIVAGFLAVKTSAEPEPGLFSQSDFHRLTGLDRATIADRLDTVASRPGKRNAKLYTLTDALPALIAGRDVSLDQVKLKTASHREKREEIELRQAMQELADRREVSTEVQELFKALHRRLAVQFWREHSGKLHKAKTTAELAKLGQTLQDKIWNALRSNYKTLTGSD